MVSAQAEPRPRRLASELGGTSVDMLGLSEDARFVLDTMGITTIEDLLPVLVAQPQLAARVLDVDGGAIALRQRLGELASRGELTLLAAPSPPRRPLDQRLGLHVDTTVLARPLAGPDRHRAAGARRPPATELDLDLIVGLHDRLGTPRDQGDRSTCVGHALASAAELAHQPLQLSPQFVYYHAKQIDGRADVSGTYLWAAARPMTDVGICLEALWPYAGDVRPDDETHGQPSSGAIADAATRRALPTSSLLSGVDREALWAHLDEDRAVVLGVQVFGTWDGDESRRTGKITMPGDDAIAVGGHAVCVVGYGYSEEVFGTSDGWFFLARNSWGTWWAPANPFGAGHVLLPARYVETYGVEAAVPRYA